jgi:AraC-like DNA-binding protein
MTNEGGQQYPLSPGWRIVLVDLGLSARNILRRAQLPEDLFGRDRPALSADAYFRLWRALEDEAADATLPIRVCRALSAEAFDPPLFAALCSPDLNTALTRLARYKPLVCPLRLDVNISKRATTLGFNWLVAGSPPLALVATELLFFVQLARMATREPITPLRIVMPQVPSQARAFRSYLGVGVERGAAARLVFAATDAVRPFVTENESMWAFFEPSLRERLSQLARTASTEQRVTAALHELLPGGGATLEGVARKLGTSSRTLQRLLQQDGSSFQELLARTRAKLAMHYLARSTLSNAEISFLLGFSNPNSFYRAFVSWRGQTPEEARASVASSLSAASGPTPSAAGGPP